jgi:hypothetical protein
VTDAGPGLPADADPVAAPAAADNCRSVAWPITSRRGPIRLAALAQGDMGSETPHAGWSHRASSPGTVSDMDTDQAPPWGHHALQPTQWAGRPLHHGERWWRGLPARAGAAPQWARCPLHHGERWWRGLPARAVPAPQWAGCPLHHGKQPPLATHHSPLTTRLPQTKTGRAEARPLGTPVRVDVGGNYRRPRTTVPEKLSMLISVSPEPSTMSSSDPGVCSEVRRGRSPVR